MNWHDVADLDFSSREMRDAMLDAMKYWVTEVGVNGYRCDYAKECRATSGKGHRGIKENKRGRTVDACRRGKAELLTYGFDILYGWDFAYKLQDLYAGKISPAGLYETHHKEQQGVGEGQQRMRYSTNHDMASEKSALQAFNGEQGALSAFVISATMGGTPMIYSSQEIGYSQPLSFFRQNTLDWNSNPTYTSEYKDIMDVYTTSDALKKVPPNLQHRRCSELLRASQNEEVLIMVNPTNQKVEVKLPSNSLLKMQ